jgi:transposase-like protein
MRIAKKCPVCNSTKFGKVGVAGSKVRMACARCHFVCVIKKDVLGYEEKKGF